VTDHVLSVAVPSSPRTALTPELLDNALKSLVRVADREEGGFGSAPKFPHPMDVRLLMRCWKRTSGSAADEALSIATLTLEKMARGGIYDHLGGGFARYSTDSRWLVPHFEKMLYDNALLIPAYLEAWQITGRADFRTVAIESLDYVLREMTQPDGGFYSTQDADSEGVEGKFFVWSEAEIDSILQADAAAFKLCYDVTGRGNWEHQNILNRRMTHDDAAKALKQSPESLEELLARCRQTLFDVRSKRIHPGRDEKLLVSWNGMMIAAMAMGARVLNVPKYAAAAASAADFILARVRSSDGGLLHCFKDGRARFNAYLDDYACLIDGLCELYQSVFDARYLAAALELSDRLLRQFWDDEQLGYFYTSDDHESLIARTKETHDNATPSGNGMAATALLKLARLTGRADLEARAVATLEMMSGQLARVPMACGQSLIALDFLLGPSHELTIAAGNRPDDAQQLLTELSRVYLPNIVVHYRAADVSDAELPACLQAGLSLKLSRDQQATMFVCQNGTCGEPAVGDLKIREAMTSLSTRHA
jgi:uncharacterized protein YyaL (SSP411 family)